LSCSTADVLQDITVSYKKTSPVENPQTASNTGHIPGAFLRLSETIGTDILKIKLTKKKFTDFTIRSLAAGTPRRQMKKTRAKPPSAPPQDLKPVRCPLSQTIRHSRLSTGNHP
jgi:hypothetical protein